MYVCIDVLTHTQKHSYHTNMHTDLYTHAYICTLYSHMYIIPTYIIYFKIFTPLCCYIKYPLF